MESNGKVSCDGKTASDEIIYVASEFHDQNFSQQSYESILSRNMSDDDKSSQRDWYREMYLQSSVELEGIFIKI